MEGRPRSGFRWVWFPLSTSRWFVPPVQYRYLFKSSEANTKYKPYVLFCTQCMFPYLRLQCGRGPADLLTRAPARLTCLEGCQPAALPLTSGEGGGILPPPVHPPWWFSRRKKPNIGKMVAGKISAVCVTASRKTCLSSALGSYCSKK